MMRTVAIVHHLRCCTEDVQTHAVLAVCLCVTDSRQSGSCSTKWSCWLVIYFYHVLVAVKYLFGMNSIRKTGD